MRRPHEVSTPTGERYRQNPNGSYDNLQVGKGGLPSFNATGPNVWKLSRPDLRKVLDGGRAGASRPSRPANCPDLSGPCGPLLY